MKKFLFVALLGGSLIACNDTSTTMTHEDSVKYNDSVANASGTTTPSTMGNDSTGTTTPMNGTGSDSSSNSNMMSDSGSTMMSDSSHK